MPAPPATGSNSAGYPRRRVLITGSSGAVGRVVVAALRDAGHQVRGFDRLPHGNLVDEVIGDVQDAGAWSRAIDGTDTLIHLAATTDDADFVDELLGPNVVGTHRALEAAVAHGLQRVILASTMQVISGWFRDHPDASADHTIGVDVTAPRNHYALTKLWAEEAGRMAAQVHGLSVIAARIGWLARSPAGLERIAHHPGGARSYVSHRDAARFFRAAVEAEHTGFGRFWCVSRGVPDDAGTVQSRYDLLPGREALGYDPLDVYPQGSWFGPDGNVLPPGDGSLPTP